MGEKTQMPIGTELANALRSFSLVEKDIVTAGQRTTADNAMDFVRLRRSLVMEFAALGTALEKEPLLAANPDQKTQVMRLFSAFRAQNSINQADWPVVRVKDNPEIYRNASSPVGERSRAFWTWIEQELGYKR